MPIVVDAFVQQSSRRPSMNWSALRLISLCALLVGEILLLTLRFGAGDLVTKQGWLAQFFSSISVVPQLAVVMVTASLVFGGESLRTSLLRLSNSSAVPYTPECPRLSADGISWWVWVLVHLVLFAAFIPVTARVFEGKLDYSSAALWILLAVAICFSWGLSLLRPSSWLLLLKEHGYPLLGCLGVGVAAWGFGQLSERMWLPLGQSTLWLVVCLLRPLTSQVVIEPSVSNVGVGNFIVNIAPQCSGYEGIGLAWIFIGTYLWWCRRELLWPNAWLLLPLATGLMWLLNGARIAALIMIGAGGWPNVALGGFHSQAGWLAFNFIMLGIVAWSRGSKFFTVHSTATTRSTGGDPTPAYLLPLFALLGMLMITDALSDNFDWLYPTRVLVVGAILLTFSRAYAAFDWTWSWPSIAIGGLVFALWLGLDHWMPAQNPGGDLGFELAQLAPPWAMIWLASRIVGSVIIAPIAEELAFRGYLVRRIQAVEFETVPLARLCWPALLISSLLFGALHPGRFVASTLAGLLYGLAAVRRGNLVDAILAHSVTNALLAAYVLATGSWNLW